MQGRVYQNLILLRIKIVQIDFMKIYKSGDFEVSKKPEKILVLVHVLIGTSIGTGPLR
jgi:hypothetical protein